MKTHRRRIAGKKKPTEVITAYGSRLSSKAPTRPRFAGGDQNAFQCIQGNPPRGVSPLENPGLAPQSAMIPEAVDDGASARSLLLIAVLILGLVKLYAFWGGIPLAMESVEFNDFVPDMQMDTNGVVVKGLLD